MPHPNHRSPNFKLDDPFSMFAKNDKELQADLLIEISQLRKEIAKLREDLVPVPSLIVIGRQAIDEFERLSKGR